MLTSPFQRKMKWLRKPWPFWRKMKWLRKPCLHNPCRLGINEIPYCLEENRNGRITPTI